MFTFDSSTSAADPGTGEFRLNNATPFSATEIYVSNTSADGKDFLEGVHANGFTRVMLEFRCKSNPDRSVGFYVTDNSDDLGGWVTLTVVGVNAGSDNGSTAWPTTSEDFVVCIHEMPNRDVPAFAFRRSVDPATEWNLVSSALWMDTSTYPDSLKVYDEDDVWRTIAVTPAQPYVASVGAEFSSTGIPTAALPGAEQADDILLLILQSSNDAAMPTPTDYKQLGPATGIGPGAAAGSMKLGIFWKRHDGSETAPTLTDLGDHSYGVMLAIRGCPTTGDPFHFLGNNRKTTASTTGTSPAGATAVDNCLVIDIFGHAVDNASGQGSSPTNTGLSGVNEDFDDATTDGTGGGIYVMSGVKVEAGDIPASTVTWANSTVDVCSRIAFLPGNMIEVASSPRPIEKQVFYGTTADLDDTWVKPSGAKQVFVQLCDGGGGGGGGRSAATAAGGGGGGGGGYDEAWYRPEDLGATVTVHAGRGGAAGSADGAGNAGVVSEFDKGGLGPLTSARRVAGTAATAPASADGGNGGCGSGRGTVSPAVETTRRTLTTNNAGKANAHCGAAGGSGTTAPTGGSQGDWGGGGGESGGDTDASITPANNGSSMSGAGGGGGGRTNTNVGRGGNGGGATNATATQGASGTDSARLPFGGTGGNGGGSSVAAGGAGGFPGGGGGGGGGVASGTGGRGGDGCVVVTTFF